MEITRREALAALAAVPFAKCPEVDKGITFGYSLEGKLEYVRQFMKGFCRKYGGIYSVHNRRGPEPFGIEVRWFTCTDGTPVTTNLWLDLANLRMEQILTRAFHMRESEREYRMSLATVAAEEKNISG